MDIWVTKTEENGVIRQWWDDTTRTYHEYNGAGVEVQERAYTTQENEMAEKRALAKQEDANRRTIEEALVASLASLQAIIDDTNANINANPAARIKDLARVQRRVIRLIMRRFQGTS